ncbi:hypothetical protein HPB51_016470 [Rhipicephalus microplus]|uniref:Uncharacterized protein n=1 Tax=Rhipicephalus microplus TaxID=6941 RepID=A0A9J6DVC1_RHIMP|nr:hypothetical protein HPB51_016470 [Rhipicephalus microplus]
MENSFLERAVDIVARFKYGRVDLGHGCHATGKASPVNSKAMFPFSSFAHVSHSLAQTERVRGHCSALTLLGKSFPVCKNGDRISVNNHECAHMAA